MAERKNNTAINRSNAAFMNLDTLYTELFRNFVGRDEALKKVKRYGNYPVVLYRSSLYEHCRRMVFLLQYVEHEIKAAGLDFDRLIVMAFVHDDVEIVIGDIVAGDKAVMSSAQLQEVADAESRAIDVLGERFPTSVGSYRYADLLHEAHDMKTSEAWLLKYIDRFDAFGEALHEVHAGNATMTESIISQYGKNPTPFDFYIEYLSSFSGKNPQLSQFFINPVGIFKSPEIVDFLAIARQGKLHAKENFEARSPYEPYWLWKQSVLRFGSAEDINYLLNPRE